MESSQSRRVLIVANRTATTPTLLDAVERLARERPTDFSLLSPDAPKSEHTDWTMELALPLLERAAGSPLEGLTGGEDRFEAIRQAVADGNHTEIVISTLPKRVSKWLRRGSAAPRRGFGFAVTVITPEQERLPGKIGPSPAGMGRP